MIQQRALADACLTPQDDDSTLTGKRIGHKPVKCLAVASTSEQPRRLNPTLAHCSLQAPAYSGKTQRRGPQESRYQTIVRLAGYATRALRPLPGTSTGARQPSARQGGFLDTTHRRV